MENAHHPAVPAAPVAMPVPSAAPAMMPPQGPAMMPPQAPAMMPPLPQAPPQPPRVTPAKRGREDDEPYMMDDNGGLHPSGAGGAGTLRSGQPWTTEENQRLSALVEAHHERQWKQIAAGLPGRSESQCWHHWRYVLKPDIDRGSWTPEEDQQLIALVQQHGRKWSVIGRSMPQRTPKRIRERYLDQLDPELSKLPWSPEEDRILSEKHAQLGSRWAAISKSLPGRGGHAVKLRWLSRQRGAADAEMGRSRTGGGASGSGVGALVGAAAAAYGAPQAHGEGAVDAGGSGGEGGEGADGNKKGKGKAKAGEGRAQPQWSAEESARLRELVDAKGARNWAALSRQMPGRTDLQCMLHWQHVLNPQLVKGRGTWSAEDDEQLRRLVEEHGRKWSRVAQHMPGRVGKQCRERYLNHLDPSLKREPWSPEEERILDDACRRMGKKWAEIARLLQGRSENDVKNAWHSLLRRRSGGGSTSAVGASRPLNYGSGRRAAASTATAPAAASQAPAAASAAPIASPAISDPSMLTMAHNMVPGATPGLAGMPLPTGAAVLPPAGSGGAGSGGSIPMLPGGGMPYGALLPPSALMPAITGSGNGNGNEMSPANAMSAIAAAAAAIGDVGSLALKKPKTEAPGIFGGPSSNGGGASAAGSGSVAASSPHTSAATAAPTVSGLPGGAISSGISTASFAPPPMPIGFAPPLSSGVGGVRLEQPGQGQEGGQPLPHVQAAMMAAAAAIANGMSSGSIPPPG